MIQLDLNVLHATDGSIKDQQTQNRHLKSSNTFSSIKESSK